MVPQRIGFWSSSIEDDPYVFPQELSGYASDHEIEPVAAYLESGATHKQYRGYSWCRFRCDIAHAEMGSRDMTDGHWIWPEGLSHYVRFHGVRLPNEFLATVSGKESLMRGKYYQEDGFWGAWCTRQRSKTKGRKADRLKARYQRERDWLRERAIKVQADSQGLSGVKCAWVDCDQRAAKDRAFCVRHLGQGGFDLGLSPGVNDLRNLYSELLIQAVTK